MQRGKETKRDKQRELSEKNSLGCCNLWVALIVIAQFVSGSHQSSRWTRGLRINKPDALCRRYLPSSHSTPSTAIANFSLLPLLEGQTTHTVATLCGIEVSLHLYENKLFFKVRRMRDLARLAVYCLGRRVELFSLGHWFHTKQQTEQVIVWVRRWEVLLLFFDIVMLNWFFFQPLAYFLHVIRVLLFEVDIFWTSLSY